MKELARQITAPPVTSEDFAAERQAPNAPTLSRFWKIVAKAAHRGRPPQKVSFVLEWKEPVSRKTAKRRAQDAIQKRGFRVQGWAEITPTTTR